MDNYDPNIFEGTHIIRVTMQQWGYKGHVAFPVGGNCKGTGVLQSGFDFPEYDVQEDIDRYTENDCKFAYHDDEDGDGWYSCRMKNDAGDEMDCDDLDENDVKRMIVAVEIVSFEKDEAAK